VVLESRLAQFLPTVILLTLPDGPDVESSATSVESEAHRPNSDKTGDQEYPWVRWHRADENPCVNRRDDAPDLVDLTHVVSQVSDYECESRHYRSEDSTTLESEDLERLEVVRGLKSEVDCDCYRNEQGWCHDCNSHFN
jgi:hypothetical protein